MAIIIDPDDKNKKVVVIFSGDDATMAMRQGLVWLGDQLGHIVIPRGKQPKK